MEEQRILIGSSVSKGIAKAKTYHYEALVLDIEVGCFKPGKETEYWKAFQDARILVQNELQSLRERISSDNKNEADIFMVHMMILEDEDLLYDIQNAILKDCMYPEIAIEACFNQRIAELQQIGDDAMVHRAMDLYDVKRRLLRNYLGKTESDLSNLQENVIVVAERVLSSDIAMIDREHVKGIITEKNSTNAHVALLAKAYGIPMITGVANIMEKIPDGIEIYMDGAVGEIILPPAEEEK